MSARDQLVEAAASRIVNSRERQALLIIARDTFDPWARETASVALAAVVAVELGDEIAGAIAEEVKR